MTQADVNDRSVCMYRLKCAAKNARLPNRRVDSSSVSIAGGGGA